MKNFFNKLFSNANKLINVTCAVLSVIVFVLCIFNIVSKIFSNTYEGSSNQMYVEDNFITNDFYATEGSFSKREKISFTKEADGTYGETAILEVFAYLDAECTRAYAEGGVISQSSGVTTATAAGVEVVQANSMYCEKDSSGKIYYEEANKELSSSGYGPLSCMRVSAFGDSCRYELHKDNLSYISMNDKVPKGKFDGTNVKDSGYLAMIENVGAFCDVLPLGFTTNINEIDMQSCELIENIVGYKIVYNVKIDGNDYVKNYAKKFERAAIGVKNSTKISRFQIAISFNKYGQITSFDSNYSFKLRKVVPILGDVEAATTGSLSTVITYKNADFKVNEF